jgi:hypothetical protein
MEETAGRFINPLASFALNRLNEWLTQAEGGRWQGDERFSVDWQGSGDDTVVCLLSQVGTSSKWAVTWKPKYGEATIELAKRLEDGTDEVLAQGEIDDGERVKRLEMRDFYTTPSGPGAVCGNFLGDGYEQVFALMQALSSSMPEDFRMHTDNVVTGERQGYFEGQIGLLAFDGGLPGAACAAYVQTVLDIAFEPAAERVRDTAGLLAGQLEEAGAIWGKSILTYHGGDISVCAIAMPDRSPAFYHGNGAKWSGEIGYISWFENFGTDDVRLCVQMFNDADDLDAIVEAVVSGNGNPSLAYDYERKSSPAGRASWSAREFFFFDYAIDLQQAVEEGISSDNFPWKAISLANPPKVSI